MSKLKLVSILVATPLILVLYLVQLILEGWVVSILWGWFVAPLGLAEITIAQGAGMSLLLAVCTHQFSNLENKQVPKLLLDAFMRPSLALLAGWAIYAIF